MPNPNASKFAIEQEDKLIMKVLKGSILPRKRLEKEKTPSGVFLIAWGWANRLDALHPPRFSPQPDQIGVMEVIWAEPSKDWKICTTASPVDRVGQRYRALAFEAVIGAGHHLGGNFEGLILPPPPQILSVQHRIPLDLLRSTCDMPSIRQQALLVLT